MATLEPGEVSVPLSIIRTFVAPRAEVYRNWANTEDLSAWFSPDGYTVTRGRVEARADTTWYIDSESETGQNRREFGLFRETVDPKRLIFTLTQQDGEGHSEQQTLITVVFADQGTMTEMTFIQTGLPASTRDLNAQGWTERFDKLDRHLRGEEPSSDSGASEAEVRRDLNELFEDGAARDLDAVMTKFSDDVVSYEPEVPLVHDGTDDLREALRRDFDQVDGGFRWDVPDLRVVVRDDIAVTWGLNRTRHEGPDGETVESWSRGTRVFRRAGDRWQIIHQHVSFPFDPETGTAVKDLTP